MSDKNKLNDRSTKQDITDHFKKELEAKELEIARLSDEKQKLETSKSSLETELSTTKKQLIKKGIVKKEYGDITIEQPAITNRLMAEPDIKQFDPDRNWDIEDKDKKCFTEYLEQYNQTTDKEKRNFLIINMQRQVRLWLRPEDSRQVAKLARFNIEKQWAFDTAALYTNNAINENKKE